MSDETMPQEAATEPPFLLAPWGQYFRYVFATHLRHLTIVASALLSLALTIDLVPQIAKVIANAPPDGVTSRVLLFIGVRAADLFPRFLPLAIYFSVLWTEIIQTTSRERILIWNTGRTAVLCLVPVLVLGTLIAPIQYAFDSYIRPVAIGIQADMALGSAGNYYAKVRTSKTSWMNVGHDLIRAEVEFHPSLLRHVMIYRLDDFGHLREIDSAQTATAFPDGQGWVLHNGQYWSVPLTIDAGGGVSTDVLAAGPADAIRFQEKPMAIPLDPVWVKNFGMDIDNLPQSTLIAMWSKPHTPEIDAFIHARVQINRAYAFTPLAMALLATVLSLTLFPYAVDFASAFLVILGGYAAYLLSRTLSEMGEQNFVPTFMASWFTPLFLVGIAAVLLFNSERKRRARERNRFADIDEPVPTYTSHAQN
jgi:lipopolysaccharide export LptBFGC system permease protein LptF